MSVAQIKNIADLIQLESGEKIHHHEIKRLTAPGENYGSLMLSVDLTVKTRHGNKKVHTVAKMLPPNDFMQEIFNTQTTFRNEIAFYKKVVPALQKFQREMGVKKVVDFACKCYGARLNLTGDENKVDADAVLVLENLKVENYVTLERTEGLDFEAARLVLVNLAHFHAVPLALRLTKLKEFESEIKPYLAPWHQKEEMHQKGKHMLGKLVDQIPEIKSLKQRILDGFDRQANDYEIREKFATVTHNDCWTNNNMFKLEGTKPVKSIILDFQMCGYGSPARDIIFFLFSSVKNRVIEEKYDHLLNEYYQAFISVLKELKCDTKVFTFEAFQEELDFAAKHTQFGHIAFMLFPIYAQHDQVKDVSELSSEAMANQEASEQHKQKLAFIVKEFAKRNWI